MFYDVLPKKYIFITMVVLMVLACSGAEDSKNEMAQKLAKNALGSAVAGKISVDPDGGVSIPLKSGTVSLGTVTRDHAIEEIAQKSFLPVGAKMISRIGGLQEGVTYNISIEAGIEEAGSLLNNHLADNGYKKIDSYLLDGMFSGNWVNEKTETDVRIYAHQKGKKTRVYLTTSKTEKADAKKPLY